MATKDNKTANIVKGKKNPVNIPLITNASSDAIELTVCNCNNSYSFS